MIERGAILRLALASLGNRRATVALTALSIAVSVALLVGVERVRVEARAGFASTISGTDLVVGARTGPVQLLLYSVFRIGNASADVSWESYRKIAGSPLVAWSIPIALGDSHRGFRVLGTNLDYFRHYRFGRDRSLGFRAGGPFDGLYEAVIGAEVARELGYAIGQEIVIAHGLGSTSFVQHDDQPFRVVGILERTGTPVDQTVHVSLQAIEAIHAGWERGMPAPGAGPRATPGAAALTPDSVTAFFLGLRNRVDSFRLQRAINEFPEEALLAILPGVALQQLWGLLGMVEKALLAISLFVVVAGLLGLLAAILTSLNERRREMAILRSVGARPRHVFALLLLEAGLVALAGALAGVLGVSALMLASREFLAARLGVYLQFPWPGAFEAAVVAAVVLAAMLLATWPAWRAYRNSLADGLTVRI